MKKPVEDILVEPGMTVSKMLEQFGKAGGFSAAHLSEAVEIFSRMVKQDDCKVFLSFPACIMATGTRGVLVELVKRKLVDVIITTCGTLDHDLARSWAKYYHGRFDMDDAGLFDAGVNRLGNVLVPNECYGTVLEDRMLPVLKELYAQGKKELSTRELAKEFGQRMDDEKSLLYWAAVNDIPIYTPGITDGAFGSNLWMFTQEHRDFKVNLFRDEQELSDIVFTAKSTGALMVGGGISKHHTIWWNQYRGGLDMAVYITTAVEHDGSLSGARIKEAVSWGKVQKEADHVTVDGDATILLPLIVAGLVDKME